MTRYIVFVAMLAALLMLKRRGMEQTFLWVWIPFFLFMPTAFWVNIPGLPDPNFMQAAILPMLFILFRDQLSKMQLGRMEWLIAMYFVVRVFCDFLSRGYSDAQNYAFYLLSALLGPYLLGRYVITSRRMDIETARMFVLCFLIFFPMHLYELRSWVSPVFKLLGGFFPNAGSGLSIRWGMARTAGTFEHPILACIMIIAVYRLHRWLTWQGIWQQPQSGWLGFLQRQAKRFPFSFSTQISIVLVLMALMTISRGPWIGGFAGATLAAVGNFKNRKRWLIVVICGFLVGGVGGQIALDAYITPAEGEVLTDSAKTMLYRKEMIDQYKAFLMDKMWTGWGLTTVPTIRGMESVDNAFFLMALQHGIIAPALFLLILFYAIISQVKFGLAAPVGESPLGFTFAGIYLMCLVSFATVYMGAQTEPLIFLMLGWGESIKRRRKPTELTSAMVQSSNHARSPFRRVIY